MLGLGHILFGVTIQSSIDSKGDSIELVFSRNLSIAFLPAHVGNLNLLWVSENHPETFFILHYSKLQL